MTLDEVRNASTGVLLLFLGRVDGLKLMDRSVDGFWRSFQAVILVLPSAALSVVAGIRLSGNGAFVPGLLQVLPLILLDFALLPALLAAVARPLGLTKGYVDFVVARNWSAPIAAALLAVPALLEGAGWLGPDASLAVSLGMLGLVLRFQWMALRLALRTDVPMGAALLIADFLISLLLSFAFIDPPPAPAWPEG